MNKYQYKHKNAAYWTAFGILMLFILNGYRGQQVYSSLNHCDCMLFVTAKIGGV